MKNGTSETAFSAKLAAHGITANTVRLDLALAQFMNNNGTFAEALDRVCNAFGVGGEAAKALLGLAAQHYDRDEAGRFVAFNEKGSEGQKKDASNGHGPLADASRQNGGGNGQKVAAEQANHAVPLSPSTQRNGAGQGKNVDKATPPLPRPVSAIPTSKRDVAAIVRAGKALSTSIFDTLVLPDGRKFGNLEHHELPKVASQYRSISRICMMAYNHGTPVDPTTKVRDLLKDEDLQTFVGQAERFNDIA